MKNKRDPWIRVKDESRLGVGMLVRLVRPGCGKAQHTFFLLGKEDEPTECEQCGECLAWKTTNEDHDGYSGGLFCPKASIREGRLYRLADGQLADDAEPATVVRGREMERAR